MIHPGSGGEAKRWDLENYFFLENYFNSKGYEVFYLLGETERNLLRLFESKNIFYNSSLTDIIFLLQYAKGFIGGDSGPGHLAGLIGVNGLLLFGPSDVNIFKPYKNLNVVKVSDNVNDVKPIYIIKIWEEVIEKR